MNEMAETTDDMNEIVENRGSSQDIFAPFGSESEWEAEMNKLPKKVIISFFKKLVLAAADLRARYDRLRLENEILREALEKIRLAESDEYNWCHKCPEQHNYMSYPSKSKSLIIAEAALGGAEKGDDNG